MFLFFCCFLIGWRWNFNEDTFCWLVLFESQKFNYNDLTIIIIYLIFFCLQNIFFFLNKNWFPFFKKYYRFVGEQLAKRAEPTQLIADLEPVLDQVIFISFCFYLFEFININQFNNRNLVVLLKNCGANFLQLQNNNTILFLKLSRIANNTIQNKTKKNPFHSWLKK